MPHKRTKETIIKNLFRHNKEITDLTQKILESQYYADKNLKKLRGDHNNKKIANDVSFHQKRIEKLLARINIVDGFIKLDTRLFIELIDNKISGTGA